MWRVSHFSVRYQRAASHKAQAGTLFSIGYGIEFLSKLMSTPGMNKYLENLCINVILTCAERKFAY
jgi:hypothetical protein